MSDEFTKQPIWRPLETIRGKVIGIILNQDRLLVCEVLDDDGNRKGWVPIGGGIDFGESSIDALKREIKEELGCECKIIKGPSVCENIFEHHGFLGHEIILVYFIELADPQIYHKNHFYIFEDNGSKLLVEWINLEKFISAEETFFPQAILAEILQ